jgi:hypothetical protein
MNTDSIIKSPKSSGRAEMLKFAIGKPLTRKGAMKAKCFECCNGYIDGMTDCGIKTCPLYEWMPYRPKINSFTVGSSPEQEEETNHIDS